MVTLSRLSIAVARQEPLERVLWRLMAFLGRYGHQPISELMRLSSREASMLAKEVAAILESENEITRTSND